MWIHTQYQTTLYPAYVNSMFQTFYCLLCSVTIDKRRRRAINIIFGTVVQSLQSGSMNFTFNNRSRFIRPFIISFEFDPMIEPYDMIEGTGVCVCLSIFTAFCDWEKEERIDLQWSRKQNYQFVWPFVCFSNYLYWRMIWNGAEKNNL